MVIIHESTKNSLIDMVPIVIMTRIDEICKITEKDTSKVFRSRMVKEKVIWINNSSPFDLY